MKDKTNVKTQQELFAILKEEFDKALVLDGVSYKTYCFSDCTQFIFKYKDIEYIWFVNLEYLIIDGMIHYYMLYTLIDLIQNILINKKY